jgi:polyhydroxyalkanoate synthesis regulator protein
MEMFEAAAGAFQPGAKQESEEGEEPAAGRTDEVAALKAQLAQLQEQIDKLNK